MATLVDAFDEILKPQFTRFNHGRKRPTEQSIERLTEQADPPGETGPETVKYYLVEVELGYLRDINAQPSIFPAARMTYLSKRGRLNHCLVKTVPNENGDLEPKSNIKPVAIRPWKEGEPASDEQWQDYAAVLVDAHGLDIPRKGN